MLSMVSSLSLSTRASFSLVVLVVVAVLSAATALFFDWRVSQADQHINHEEADVRMATDLQAALFHQRICVDTYLVSDGEVRWRQEIGAHEAKFQSDLAALRRSAERTDELALIAKVAEADARYDDERGQVLALFDQGRKTEAREFFLSRMTVGYEGAMAAAESVREVNRTDMRSALAANSAAMSWLGTTMITSAALTVLLGAGMFWLLFSRILRPLRKMAAQVRVASNGADASPGPRIGSEVAELGYYLHAIVSELDEARSTARQERSRDDQAARLAALGTAVAHVAHDFKNALTSIGGFARFIERHPEDPGRVREEAAIIARSCTRLEQLVHETVDYSRPNMMEPVVQSLNAAVQETLAGIASRVPKSVKLEMDLGPEVPDVPFDAVHLERVIANLVGNALEAVGTHGEVRVRTRPCDLGVELVIEDNGPGIPPMVRQRLFEPFFTTKQKGSGLGLPICRQIVTGHGGTVCYEPAPSGGTVFRVTLPRGKVPFRKEGKR